MGLAAGDALAGVFDGLAVPRLARREKYGLSSGKSLQRTTHAARIRAVASL